MRFMRFMFAVSALMAFTAGARAADPREGVEYQRLASPVRTEAPGKKVEVVEFFMYTCPHCHSLDPMLSDWVKKQGDKISFRRIHFPQGGSDPLAHAYITLEAMGQPDAVHSKIFRAIHIDRSRIYRDEKALNDFIVANGIDKAKYDSYFNSFAVQTKLKRSAQAVAAYKVDSAPTIVIDGRFVTSPTLAGKPGQSEAASQMQTLAVMDYLVNKAAAEKK
ncbi:thiol:disulfide interchange protein DsbA/DsbL [Massilia endophytica]|uniref:thiol:disulfide interchange protein DsbA/DsbL n=1 Tax=Massilia endophytica TaxID=2899220 RepID=UPI001E33C02B|nr:thiol:disulfide interchange protein DsbA/DsbL [Massilia endophytica]UGQ47578.1 thiol:disulfide interchange protein DsbA/DsbL [Massilia endophytica]